MTTYECNKCKALDSDRGPDNLAPLALICWSCRNGAKQKGPIDQLQVRRGMFPLISKEGGQLEAQ